MQEGRRAHRERTKRIVGDTVREYSENNWGKGKILAVIKRTNGYLGGRKPEEASVDFEVCNRCISVGTEGA